MRSGDFLLKAAETPICRYYVCCGAVCRLSTNSELLVNAAAESFLRLNSPDTRVDFTIRILVDETLKPRGPWPKPYVRGLDDLVFAGFEPASSILIDLRSHQVIGRLSAGMVADQNYVKSVVFPMMFSIISSSIGVAELHCACVVKHGNGFLLAGPSGSGKSTLSVALARSGFGFLSDDRSYCSQRDGRLFVWGLRTPLKLRRDATNWFEELQKHEPADLHNGEAVFRLEPESPLGLKRAWFCEPCCLVFLERREKPGLRMTGMSSVNAADLLEQELRADSPERIETVLTTIRKLSALPCWSLQHGEQPQKVARELVRHFAEMPLSRGADARMSVTTNSLVR
jgi:hypothetical protein